MLQCPFLTTMEEEVDCFNECELHKLTSSEGNCPFIEVKNFKPFAIKNISDYDSFDEDKTSPIRMLYKEKYS